MQSIEFKNWLIQNKGKGERQSADNVSRIKRVEREFSVIEDKKVNIDDECKANQCSMIFDSLCLTKRQEMKPNVNLPQNTAGLSQLKSAVRNYVEFYNEKH